MRRLAIAGAMSSSVSTANTPGSARAAVGADGADQRMRMRAAHEGGVQRIGDRDVVRHSSRGR